MKKKERNANRTHRYGLKSSFCAVCGVYWDSKKAEEKCPGFKSQK